MQEKKSQTPIKAKKIPVRIVVCKTTVPKEGQSLEGAPFYDILSKCVLQEYCDDIRPITKVTNVFVGLNVCNVNSKAVYICLTRKEALKWLLPVAEKDLYLVMKTCYPKVGGTLKNFKRFKYIGKDDYFKYGEELKESKMIKSSLSVAPGVFLVETEIEKYLVMV